VENKSLTILKKEMGKIPIPTKEEEIELVRLSKRGDKKAIEKLVCGHQRFVYTIARKFEGLGVPLTDLINEGNLGLIKSIKTYDPKRKVRFLSHAVWRIRQAIIFSIYENRLIKVPLNKVNLACKVKKELDNGYSVEDIAKKLDVKEASVQRAIQILKPVERLDAPEDTVSLTDVLSTGENTEESVEHQILRKYILDRLTKKEALVITEHYGLNDLPKSLEQIGRKLKISRERVRQLKFKTLKKIRLLL
jgi:RNA polymerase primary sigma factor